MFGPRSRLHRFENLTLVFFSRHQKLAKYINRLHHDLQCLLNNSVVNVNQQAQRPNPGPAQCPSTRSLSNACQPQGPSAGQSPGLWAGQPPGLSAGHPQGPLACQPQGFSAGSEVQCSVVQVPSMERQVMASLLVSCQGLCEPGERLMFKLSVLGHTTFCAGRSTG